MENTMLSGQEPSPAYDYRAYDQIWQRVTPGVDPFSGDAMNPAASAVPASAASAVPAAQPVPRQEDTGGEATLPGADPNPCCMGTGAQDSTGVLEGFIQEELAGARCCQCMQTCNQAAAQLFRRIACEKQAAARELCGAYYLITGSRYSPAITVEHVHCGNLAEALRSCYHQEACAGLNYARAADETTDKCLTDLFNKYSVQAYRRAEEVMSLLGKVVC